MQGSSRYEVDPYSSMQLSSCLHDFCSSNSEELVVDLHFPQSVDQDLPYLLRKNYL